jgi:hypothetical protein
MGIDMSCYTRWDVPKKDIIILLPIDVFTEVPTVHLQHDQNTYPGNWADFIIAAYAVQSARSGNRGKSLATGN